MTLEVSLLKSQSLNTVSISKPSTFQSLSYKQFNQRNIQSQQFENNNFSNFQHINQSPSLYYPQVNNPLFNNSGNYVGSSQNFYQNNSIVQPPTFYSNNINYSLFKELF